MKDYKIYFDIDDTLSKYSENIKSSGISTKDTAKNLEFWVNADVMDGAPELFKFCKDNFKEVEILSAVPSHSKEKFSTTGEEFYPLPIQGKIEWVKKNFGDVKFNWTKNGKDKNKFANQNTVLIDDKVDNVKHFSNAGGIGILFSNSKQVMEELEELLTENPLNEGVVKNDYKEQIKGLTMFALNKGMNISPLPRVIFKNNDVKNADNFIGRTAYYDPSDSSIVLFTSGRDPISIVNSFSHELIHHIQNLEGRLEGVGSENIHEDDYLEEIEREAYEGGGMLLRNYKDTLRQQQTFQQNMITEIDEIDEVVEEEGPIPNLEEDKYGLNMFMKELISEIANGNKYTIYQDLDGPITDFDGQFKKYSGGIEPGDYESKMGKEAFWELIDGKIGLKFWTDMPWASDGHKLWNYIKEYKPILLSAPSRNTISSDGKKEWVKNQLPGVKLILSYADQKRKYANESSILIDDRKRNVEEWIESGGIGILWVSADDTIKQLKELGL